MASTLPRFSRGLKLARIGILIMLLQIAGMIAFVALVLMGVNDMNLYKVMDYLFLATVVATGLMLAGTAGAIPELARARMNLTMMIISALGLGIATAALAWSYNIIFNGKLSEFDTLDTIAIVKDLSYGAGLYFLVRTIQMSAAINDQLALRDRAASMGRAVMVMVLGDLFWQMTWGRGGGGGFTALIAMLVVYIYWVWCHVHLQRFLFDAAWFVNEPHNLPTATVVLRQAAPPPRPSQAAVVPRPSQPIPRPSQPSPIIAVAQPTAPTPRAESTADGQSDSDGPRFLR